MRTKQKAVETAVHGVFLILGLVTVACVLLITGYLVISGVPAIREIGLVEFLFGSIWESTAAEPKYGILPFILTSMPSSIPPWITPGHTESSEGT